MDPVSADLALQAVLGRAGDFVGGIDNEALDFSQLEAFINSDGSQGNGSYFGESLNPASGKLLNVIVENKRTPGHSLPESPPDSSSEHPYSPADACDPPLTTSETIYTTLGQPIYKQLNPIIGDGIILGTHIVVAEQPPGDGLLHHVQDTATAPEGLIQPSDQDQPNGGSYVDGTARRSTTPGDVLLVKSTATDAYDKGLLHLDFAAQPLDIQIPQQQGGAQQGGALCEGALDGMQAVYTNLQNAPKKRKLSQDLIVKSEPVVEHCSPSQLSPPANMNSSMSIDEDYAASESCMSDSQYQCIRFQAFQQTAWHALCDQNLTELPAPHYRVDADKGFNFSNADDAFVCQKKNHFQITCHVQVLGDAQFVKTADGFQKISSFHLHFYGVKHDCPTQTIRVEQSQSDRSKKPFHPVLVELVNSQITKVTVGRLHFSETTSNNMRKKGKPNPEQRYFQLVVGLHAHTTHGNFPIVSQASQKIIVRASNPGQFESDVELCWQKGQTQDSIFHGGKVGVNTDRPDESLVVHGNIKITGHIIQPSDIRAKKNIVECNTAEQLRNVQKLRVVRYEYEPGFASQLNRPIGLSDTGVIAQEVAKILPEAVRPAGNLVLDNGTSIDDFLVVNKERIFMENVGAVKELCKVTDNLETRIDQLERINKRLGSNKFRRGGDSFASGTCTFKRTKCSTKVRDGGADDELCSNKFIQVVIVVLVLIMAFCLAAITALYLMEASRHNQLTQASLQAVHRAVTTHRPSTTKGAKIRTWQTQQQVPTTVVYKDNGLSKLPVASSSISKSSNLIVGRPGDCSTGEEELDNLSLCQIYCCLPPKDANLDLFGQQQRLNRTILRVDKAKVTKPFHSNNIDKQQQRQRRDNSDYWPDRDNIYDMNIDDLHFTIIIQGKTFNATLTEQYLSSHSNLYNYSYVIPVSKYMPDESLNLIFQSSQAHLKDIEHCYNSHRQYECPLLGGTGGFEELAARSHKVNENVPSQQINPQSVIFEVDMLAVQSKVMTYRASLKQNQNKCKLSPTKLGIEFTEYNFHIYRHCND